MTLIQFQVQFPLRSQSISSGLKSLQIISKSNRFQKQRSQPTQPYLRFSSSSSSSTTSTSSTPLPPIFYSHIPYQVPYLLGLALQEHLVSRRAEARAILKNDSSDHSEEDLQEAKRISSTDFLILQEHSPVFTDGRRATVENLASKRIGETIEREGEEKNGTPLTIEGKRLIQTGADYCLTKRGGLVTYHGPGQITAYPILDLGQMGLSTRTYIQSLESSIREFLSKHHSLSTLPCNPNKTGVFFTETQKVSSIGVQVRHRISSHGFALNITNQPLNWLSKIVACGLDGVNAQSLNGRLKELEIEKNQEEEFVKKNENGDGDGKKKELSVNDVMKDLIDCLGKGLSREIKESEKGTFQFQGDEKRNLLERIWVDGKEVKS